MNICAIISVEAIAGATELAGAKDGSAWYQSVRAHLDTAQSGVLVLDFTRIRIATVSWLREAVVTLIRHATKLRPDVVVVAANVPKLVREELEVALDATSSVLIVAHLDSHGELSQPTVLGKLDSALSETLKAVVEYPSFDASVVREALPSVGPSAASNRLAALAAKGLLTSERRGRGRVYRPLLEGLRYGY